jgi:hypothetical protein
MTEEKEEETIRDILDLNPLYNEYVDYCSSLGFDTAYTLERFERLLFGEADATEYTKFEATNSAMCAIDSEKHGHRLLGYTPAVLNPSVSGTGLNLFDQVLGLARDYAGRTARDLAGKGARAVIEKAEEAAERFKSRTAGLGGPGGTGTIGNRAEGFGANGETSAFAMNTEPMKVEFLTGVNTTLYPPNMNAPSIDVGEPQNMDGREVTADMACVQLRIPPNNAFANTYWENVYIPNIQLRAQASVGFNINAGVNFAYDKVTTYFNLLFTALSKYFFMVNTYSVIQGPGQRDLSRNKIRQMFQTSDLQYLAILKERLDALPIPPTMIAEVANMYSVYKTNINSDCSNTISFTPVPLTSGIQVEPVFTTIYMGLLDTIQELGALDDPNHPTRNTVDMMSRVFPAWVATTVNPTQTFPEYSEKFIARFINSPAFQTTYIPEGSYDYRVPFVSYSDKSTKFAVCQKFEQSEIGDIQATCSIWDGSRSAWSGTMVPVPSSYAYGDPISTTRYTSRYSFVYINGIMQWVPSNYSIINGLSDFDTLPMRQPYVNYIAGSTDHYSVPFGTYELTGNSIDAMTQPSIDWLGKLFDIDSSSVKDSSYDRKPRGKRRSYGKKKGKGKTMGKEEEVA